MKNKGFIIPTWVQGVMLLAMITTGVIYTYYDGQTWLYWTSLGIFLLWATYFIYRIVVSRIGGKNG